MVNDEMTRARGAATEKCHKMSGTVFAWLLACFLAAAPVALLAEAPGCRQKVAMAMESSQPYL